MASEKVGQGPIQKSTPKVTPDVDRSQLQEPKQSGSSMWNHFTQDLRSSTFTELQLVLLTFCTGIQ
ncbi:hypothetical protein E4U53_000861, partial [Claviceps sorghi]